MYLGLGGILMILLSLALIKPKLELYKIEKEGSLVDMQITELPANCIGTKVSHYATFSYQGLEFIKRIPGLFCNEHKVGETLQMKYHEEATKILFPKESVQSEFIALGLIALFGFIFILKSIRG